MGGGLGEIFVVGPGRQLPVPPFFQLPAGGHPAAFAGPQLLHPLENAAAGRTAGAQKHQLGDAVPVKPRLDAGEGEQRFQLGREKKIPALPPVEEGFDPHPVAGDEQPLFQAVPDGEGKNAVEPVQAVFPPRDKGVQHHFGVRPGRENMPAGDKFPPDLTGVVQLPVVDDGIPGVFRRVKHRLPSGRGVDHREPRMVKGEGGKAAA